MLAFPVISVGISLQKTNRIMMKPGGLIIKCGQPAKTAPQVGKGQMERQRHAQGQALPCSLTVWPGGSFVTSPGLFLCLYDDDLEWILP